MTTVGRDFASKPKFSYRLKVRHPSHHHNPTCGPVSGHCCCGERDPAIRGYLIPCLLSVLGDAPSHGYQLAETLRERRYLVVTPDPGVIYRHLRRMEQEGLVTSGFEPGAGPARKVYTITEEGRACLEAWIGGLKQLRESLGTFLDDVTGDDSP